MKLRSSLLTCSCLAALAGPGAALAQSTTTAPSSGAALEEVVVTAQRRVESAQDVPISITVHSAERVEAAAVQSLPDIARITPGLQFQAVGAASVPYLRGVGAPTTAAGTESTVALVVDGVYISAQAASLMALANIEAVEVDRGPQGTLFGRNATGGVIQIRTKRPGAERKLDLRAGYGNYDTWEGAFYGSVPLTEDLAADIAIYARDQNKGFGTNLFNGDDVYTSYDYTVRSKWFWQVGDETEVTFIADYEKLRAQTGFATRLPRLGELGLDQRGRGGFQFSGGFYDVNLNFDSFNVTETRGASLDVLQGLGFADLRSITAYHKQDFEGHVDFDLGPNHGSHQINLPDQRTFTQEFQLLSPDTNGRLQWVLGAYLYRDLSRYDPLNIDYPAGALLSDTNIVTKQKTNSWALFGQGSFKLTDATQITIGARHTEDERTFVGQQVSAGPLPGPLLQRGHKTFQKQTYRFAIDHRVLDNVLAYASYTRGFKSGFFNPQTFQPSNSPVAAVILPETLDALEVGLKSDWLDRRLRVNIAAFSYDYKDQQVNAFLGATRILLNAANSKIKGVDFEILAEPVENLTISFNGEFLDAEYKDFPNAPKFTPAPAPGIGNIVTPFNAAGRTVVNSPKFTATVSANYKIPTSFGKVILNGDLYHNSGYYFDFANTRRQSSYELLSASVKFSFGEGERWDVTLWGSNLTDEHVYASVNQVGLGPGALFGGDSITPRPPRMYGVRVGAHF